MEDWEKRINIDPNILGGRPVIAGTRVPVYVVLDMLASGETMEVVCEQYGITADDVRAALAYAADIVMDEIVVAIPPR